jgi:hypothetical protein
MRTFHGAPLPNPPALGWGDLADLAFRPTPPGGESGLESRDATNRRTERALRFASVLFFAPLLGLITGCDDATEPSAIPVIEGVGPEYQVVGDPNALVTVSGRGFEWESVIRWNHHVLPATNRGFPSGGSAFITAVVPVSELDQPKDVVITVHTPMPGGRGANSAPWPYRVVYPVPGPCYALFPYFAEAGGPATIFRCRGRGFLPGTEVYLDHALVQSEYLDWNTLRFTAPPELLAEPGTRRIGFRGKEGWGWTSSLHVLHPVEVGSGGRQIGAGCIIDAYGLLQCWDSIPRPVVPHLRFRALRSTRNGGNSCAETVNGEIYCWGFNSYGQLGTGTFADLKTSAPTQPVLGELGLRELALGDSFACGLDSEGGAWCWGANGSGQLGTDEELTPCSSDVPCAPQPIPVAGDLRFVAIAAGWSHTCAVETTGVAYCWGNDDYGQLGNGPGRNDSRVPQQVHSQVRFASITAGSSATCALTADGAAHCWGGPWEVPTPVADEFRFQELTDGRCGLTFQGEIYCFFHEDGSPSPVVRMGEEYTWTEIRIGPRHFSICGFTTDADFLCWGGWPDPRHIEFPLVRGPEVCGYADLQRAHPMHCYPSPTAVFGVAGQAGFLLVAYEGATEGLAESLAERPEP